MHTVRWAHDPPNGREAHMTPEEALRAFVELGAQTFVPMHYGTLRLSDEPAWSRLRGWSSVRGRQGCSTGFVSCARVSREFSETAG